MGTSAWMLPGTGNSTLDQVRTRAFFRNQHVTGGSWFFVRMNLDYDLTVSNGGCGKQSSFWPGSISRDRQCHIMEQSVLHTYELFKSFFTFLILTIDASILPHYTYRNHGQLAKLAVGVTA